MNDYMTILNDFHFIRPHWLWAILPLIGLVGLLRHVHKQQSGWQSVLASHLYQHLITTDGIKKARPPLLLLGVSWVIATLALAGPTWERLPQPVYQLNTGKVVLIDMSMSMRATDITPNRLTRAKYKAIDLVNAITEGETGLVAYAGDAFTISPLSSDAQNLTTLIPSLTPEIMPIAGSEPVLGIEAAIELLTSAGYQHGEIFWITDGISNQQMKEVSELINTSSYRLSILAVGTEEGAPIKLVNGELLKDNRGAIVIPKLTTNNLKSIAKSAGGRYVSMQSNDKDIDYLMKQELLNEEASSEEEQQDNFGDKWQEMGPYLLLILLPFAAYSFRKGILSVILLTCLLPVYTPSAEASWWQDMWSTADQQGLQAFKQDDFESAANTFKNPLWRGTSQYKNKDFEGALQSFLEVPPSSNDYIEAAYNAGNALAQLGELDKAIVAYDQVLALQPEHEDALANKTLLEDLKEQQQNQQEQNQSEDQSQQSDQQEGENSDQQQSEQQNSENQETENSQEQQEQSNEPQGQDSNEQQNESSEQAEESENQDSEKQEQQAQTEQEQQESEQQGEVAEASEAELTDEEREQMQRMQSLLNKIPDDPAFLLKRKMLIESQQRKRERLPANIQRNW
ncbi:vWA domain-containing protein [Paraglaciecola sp. 2405UD69-4]|uniref:vWA domain-containing protein n=1 Tax=Paraglaciecola sp. 2405UD69-4 TaxID=3391836 RepID=UPI0039C93D0D